MLSTTHGANPISDVKLQAVTKPIKKTICQHFGEVYKHTHTHTHAHTHKSHVNYQFFSIFSLKVPPKTSDC